ncbi:MAG: response regulator [Nitrososphaera sp.]|jgi:DNA-binding response OmpR family regulator
MQNTGFPPAAGSILLVDQQQNTAELLKTYLRADGFSVDHAAAPDVALEYANQSRYGMVITDLVMNGMTGIDLYREIKARADETRFMFLLRLSAESIRLMGTLERKDVIKKEPLSINEVIGKVRAAFYYE